MIVTCTSCGTKNNIPDQVPASKQPLCGKCKQPLSLETYSAPVTVSDASFENEVLGSSMPVLLDCWAPWCGPCRIVGPVLEELAQELAGKIKICKLDVDQNPQTANKFGIQSIPTLLLFKNGELVNQMVGAAPKNQIRQFIGM